MITLKINIPMNGYKAGDKITLATDSEGNVINHFWARRLKDSKQDNCVEIFQDKQEKPVKGKK